MPSLEVPSLAIAEIVIGQLINSLSSLVLLIGFPRLHNHLYACGHPSSILHISALPLMPAGTHLQLRASEIAWPIRLSWTVVAALDE